MLKNNMSNITPFLWFENNAHEAAKFYVSIFPNSKINSTSIMDNTPSGTVEIISVNLNSQVFTLMSAGPFDKFNASISFVINCQNQDEVDHYWQKLSAHPDAEQCGWLKDKYGVSWQVVPQQLGQLMGDPDPIKSARVQQALLKTKKIIIADLQKAYDHLN